MCPLYIDLSGLRKRQRSGEGGLLWPECLKPYVEILIPKGYVLGGRAFGRCLSHESEALTNGMTALIKEIRSNAPDPYDSLVRWDS